MKKREKRDVKQTTGYKGATREQLLKRSGYRLVKEHLRVFQTSKQKLLLKPCLFNFKMRRSTGGKRTAAPPFGEARDRSNSTLKAKLKKERTQT